MISLISWLIYGIIVGYIATKIYGEELPFWTTVGVGVAGSYIGGLIDYFINGQGTVLHPTGFIFGIAGAILGLFGYKKWKEL